MNSKKRKERKQIITIVITMAVILALIVVYFIIRNATSEEPEETKANPFEFIGQNGTFTIIDENYALVTALSYSYAGETIPMHVEDGHWVMDDDADFPIDQEKIVMMSQAISDYGGFRRLQYDPSNESQYGTDDPLFDITVTYYDSTNSDTTHTRNYKIGSKNAVSGNYYFHEQGDSYVYMVNDALFQYFAYMKADLFRNTVTPTPELADINALHVITEDGEYSYDAATDTLETGTDEYHPVALIMEALPKGARLEYNDVVGYGVSGDGLSRYGLDKPAVTVELDYTEYVSVSTTDGGSTAKMPRDDQFTMMFGNTVAEGNVEYIYVTEKDSGIVYKVMATVANEIRDAVRGAANS